MTTLPAQAEFAVRCRRKRSYALTMTSTANKNLPTIVYVEDNNGDALLLEEALRARGHAVQLLIIEKGDTALHYFQVKESARDLPPPHCILLDSFLPNLSGAELLRFICGSEVFNEIPVYIFSSDEPFLDLIEEKVVAKKNFITKPNVWEGFLKLADLLMKDACECKG